MVMPAKTNHWGRWTGVMLVHRSHARLAELRAAMAGPRNPFEMLMQPFNGSPPRERTVLYRMLAKANSKPTAECHLLSVTRLRHRKVAAYNPVTLDVWLTRDFFERRAADFIAFVVVLDRYEPLAEVGVLADCFGPLSDAQFDAQEAAQREERSLHDSKVSPLPAGLAIHTC
jgi:hypothetical protein